MEITTGPHYIPTTFIRHKIKLHTLLMDNHAWFCARDLGHLMGLFLDHRLARKLDPDERRTLWLQRHGEFQETLMLSESGVYALLVYHHTAQNRQLREWLTLQVIPTLRDMHHLGIAERPTLGLLDWPDISVNLLHWQNEPWIRLRDMPNILQHESQQNTRKPESWWKKVSRFLTF